MTVSYKNYENEARAHITANYYTCIDKHGGGTAAFAYDAFDLFRNKK